MLFADIAFKNIKNKKNKLFNYRKLYVSLNYKVHTYSDATNIYFKSIVQILEIIIEAQNPSLNNILDCPIFTLNQILGQKVSDSKQSVVVDNIPLGECFLACFNMTGCNTFSYDDVSQRCQLYTGCGASCVLIVDSAVTTYVRDCVEGNTTSGIVEQKHYYH